MVPVERGNEKIADGSDAVSITPRSKSFDSVDLRSLPLARKGLLQQVASLRSSTTTYNAADLIGFDLQLVHQDILPGATLGDNDRFSSSSLGR